MKNIFIAIVALLSFSSCQKVLLGSVADNTPENNFESLWNGYDAWYGQFEVRNINWDSLHAVYKAQVNNNMNDQQLYDVMCALLKPLNDIHVFLQPTTGGFSRFESNEFFRSHKVQEDFSVDVIKQHYLPTLTTVDDKLHYGILDNNIGYIHFGDFGMPVSFYEQQMNVIMPLLKNTKGIIVDIRNHAGGADEVSRYIAGWFATERKLFMTTRKRNGPGRFDFTQPDNWYVEKQGSYQYSNPVVLLTTRWTASAGETFTWAMNTQQHVIQIGDTTAGGFSDVVARELPNAWLYFVSVGDYRNYKGESEEGKGVAPVTYIVNTKDDILSGKDKVLEYAISKF